MLIYTHFFFIEITSNYNRIINNKKKIYITKYQLTNFCNNNLIGVNLFRTLSNKLSFRIIIIYKIVFIYFYLFIIFLLLYKIVIFIFIF